MKCLAHITDNPEGHDWVLVVHELEGGHKLLWACPCSEFKWTSYAEWEGRETATPEHPDRAPTSGTL